MLSDEQRRRFATDGFVVIPGVVGATLRAVGGHASLLEPPLWLGPGEPLLARRGDLLLAHYLLGHNIGGNTTTATRRALYYRLAAEGHADRWSDTFLDSLTEYPSLRPLAPAEPFTPPPP